MPNARLFDAGDARINCTFNPIMISVVIPFSWLQASYSYTEIRTDYIINFNLVAIKLLKIRDLIQN